MSRPTFNLGLFLEKEKLKTNGSNFMSWFRNLRILLTPHKVAYVIEAALGDPPADDASVITPAYMIPALLLIFVTHRWSCGIVGAWQRTR